MNLEDLKVSADYIWNELELGRAFHAFFVTETEPRTDRRNGVTVNIAADGKEVASFESKGFRRYVEHEQLKFLHEAALKAKASLQTRKTTRLLQDTRELHNPPPTGGIASHIYPYAVGVAGSSEDTDELMAVNFVSYIDRLLRISETDRAHFDSITLTGR